MSKIKEINYERVHNLGNYETERGGVIISVDETEDPKEIFEFARDFVEEQLFGRKK